MNAACLLCDTEESFPIFYRLPYDVGKAQEKIRRAGFRRCWPIGWPAVGKPKLPANHRASQGVRFLIP